MRGKLFLIFKFVMTIQIILLTGCGGGGGGIRNIGPTISAIDPGPIDERAEVTLTVTASDEDGSIREIRWKQTSGPRINFTSNQSSITFIAPEVEQDTAFSFMINVVDDVGAISTTDISGTIVNINRAPEATDVTLQVEKNTSLDIALSATDPDNDQITYQVTQQPQFGVLVALDSANRNYRYTPDTDSLTDDEITFEVSDGDLTATAKVYFDVFEPTTFKNLVISEVSSSEALYDNRWIELYNGTGNSLSLANYALKTAVINQTDLSDSGTHSINLPDVQIKNNSYIIIQYALSNHIWYSSVESENLTVIIGDANNIIQPSWDRSGFVELLDSEQSFTVDFVRFGDNTQLPIDPDEWHSHKTVQETNGNKNLTRSIRLPDSNSSGEWYYSEFATPARVNPVDCISKTDYPGRCFK